jgi:hypothetical protein
MKFYIYEIVSLKEECDKKYIGITKDFKKRVAQHKTDFHNIRSPRHNMPIYQYIRDNGGWVYFNIEKLEEIDCLKEEKGIYERQWYDLNEGKCLNTNCPNRNQLESSRNYYNKNKDKVKQYYQDNKDKIKNYYQQNKDKIKQKYIEKKIIIEEFKQHKEDFEEYKNYRAYYDALIPLV